jgi:GNAT superfamily N-acetyltransferase
MGARWGDARAGFVPLEGHAVAEDADALAVYLAMYAAVSAAWVRDGYFNHGVHVMAADTAAHDALVAMGFGRKVVAAARPVFPLPEGTARVPVREATADDRKALHRLEMELDLFHARAPIFLPIDPATDAAAGRFMDEVIDNPRNAIFVAEQDGAPIGMNSLMPDSFIPKSVLSERSVYLYQGVVSERARAGGIGEALLARSLRWAGDSGYDQVALHYFSANPVGGAFWRKQGFVAVQYAMAHTVDASIAWAGERRT